jgi:hypothetical protein
MLLVHDKGKSMEKKVWLWLKMKFNIFFRHTWIESTHFSFKNTWNLWKKIQVSFCYYSCFPNQAFRDTWFLSETEAPLWQVNAAYIVGFPVALWKMSQTQDVCDFLPNSFLSFSCFSPNWLVCMTDCIPWFIPGLYSFSLEGPFCTCLMLSQVTK